MKQKIMIVDDHKIVRTGLRSLLEQDDRLEVVAEAENGTQAMEQAVLHSPHIVIMDISMPNTNGLVATELLLKEMPHLKIIALSMHSDRHFVEQMQNLGAKGYVLKDCAFDDLTAAINAVIEGRTYFKTTLENDDNVLTPREREVLKLLAEGQTSKEMAHVMGVSIKTIETHRTAIMKKLNIHSIAELTKYAIKEGLTGL